MLRPMYPPDEERTPARSMQLGRGVGKGRR